MTSKPDLSLATRFQLHITVLAIVLELSDVIG